MHSSPDPFERTEIRDGMRVTWQQRIPMSDGVVLRADVFRPIADGKYPVILTYGLYAKGLAYQEGYPMQWQKMVADHPEILEGSTNKYQSWEVTDPERWVPDGYAIVRVDSRGAGWSPGYLDPFSPREIDDVVECIEWAGAEAWSNGKVGMLGVSYFALNQWCAAAKNPPHLAAIIPWEGLNDLYRDPSYHGGIFSEFWKRWWPIQAVNVQYGLGDRARKSQVTGESIAGPVTLPEEELKKHRGDPYPHLLAHPLCDEWYRERSADLSKVTVPFLSCANWGGQGIHPRGNFNGFLHAASQQKWLEAHGESHWSLFSSGYGLQLQKRFFDRFLKGVDNGWEREQPKVQLNIRHPGEKFVVRRENEWPLARTEWTKFYLDPANEALTRQAPEHESKIEYDALGRGVTFSIKMPRETEITGPVAARLFVSSSTSDADLFLIVRVFDPSGKELTFFGSTDPNTPIANGWLRASHRRLDERRSQPWQPFHPHDRIELLTPGEIYQCNVEILPTSIVIPEGWTLALTVRGKDYEYEGELDDFAKKFYYGTRGTGGMTHNDPITRPPEIFGGKVQIHSGPKRESFLLLPIIPGQM